MNFPRLARTLALSTGLVFVLTGCDQVKSWFVQSPSASTDTSEASSASSTAPVVQMPDVGKAGVQSVRAQGTGASAAEAVDEAIRMALRMANGQSVDLSSSQMKLTLSVVSGKNAETLRANSFAEHIVQSSGGAITGFKMLALEGPDKQGLYKADLEAQVATFVQPADSKKLRIVLAPIRFDVSTFQVGGRTVSADTVAQALHAQVLTALNNTGRFTVLDRDLGSEIGQELEMIASGQSPRAEFGKLGQALSADVIWVGKINSYAYNRHARQLHSSDRELVSYSGGWDVSQNWSTSAPVKSCFQKVCAAPRPLPHRPHWAHPWTWTRLDPTWVGRWPTKSLQASSRVPFR